VVHRHKLLAIVLVSLGAWTFGAPKTSAGEEWQPASQEELKLTADPKAPGAPAICLYRQVDRDDNRPSHEFNYVRIKILTEEGRKYADIEIPFNKERASIHTIKARVIQPDGSMVAFDGKTYEKMVVKTRSWKYLPKTFTLPDIRVGSIIEYYYTIDLDDRYVFDSRWVLSSDLFTRHAKFTLKANPDFNLRWASVLPPGADPPKDDARVVRLQLHDIPAFLREEYMPPDNELTFRVDFLYSEKQAEKEPAKFWREEGKKRNAKFESFVNKRKAMEQAASEIVSPNDAPEVKLQKIYARVQQLRNTSFEREKTKQELKREQAKENNNVEDVWKRQAGDGRQIDWLFIALARAAGFEAHSVYVSTRNQYFFKPALMNPYQLNVEVVLVKLNGKDLYLDPGTAFAPYGLLPWSETGVAGLRLDKDGGTWVQTAVPESFTSRIERNAKLTLAEQGDLEGTLTVTYFGLEALYMRMDQRDEDDASRKKLLEDLVRESIPSGIEVDLTNQPDWATSSPTFVAQYNLKVPGWVSGAGRRAVFPVGLFSSHEKHLFEHAQRTYAVYFHYPSQKIDDFTVVMPLGWKVSSLPAPVTQESPAVGFTQKAEDQHSTLHITRKLRSDLLGVEPSNYGILRGFYQFVRTADEQQIVLQPAV